MSTDIKARPILFSAPMIRALLDGRKTVTRRIVKPQPNGAQIFVEDGRLYIDDGVAEEVPCPYGNPGDYLWCREAFSYERLDVDRNGFLPPWYWADGNPPSGDFTKPKPSIHMPRWASRLTLEITDVRVQRLTEISKADAFAEGVTERSGFYSMDWSGLGKPTGAKTLHGHDALATESFIGYDNPRGAFAAYFEQINGDDAWISDPWCWCLTFTVHKQNGDALLAERRAAWPI